MQQLPKYILSIILSLSILLSTAGIPVFAHTCNMSGATEISVVPETHGCCSAEDEVQVPGISPDEVSCEEESSCCSLQSGYYKTEAVSTAAQENEQKHMLPIGLLCVLYYYNINIASSQELTFPSRNYPAHAPPSGRTLLSEIRVLRI